MNTSAAGVRCPVCGHWTPVADRRQFVSCTCGVRLAVPVPVRVPWGRNAVEGLVAVARGLVRRLR